MSEITDVYGSVNGKFIMCSKCNKPILERLPNGLWRFKFGKPRMIDGEGRPLLNGDGRPIFQKVQTPVVIYVHGSILMKCFRKKCDGWNELNYFPTKDFSSLVREKTHI